MGVHAFVARSGWQSTPISAVEWHIAAAALPALEVFDGAADAAQRAVLRTDRRRGLVLHRGCLHADRVDRQLAVQMFALAQLLGAQVFSARRRPYIDLADWEARNLRSGRRRGAAGSEGGRRSASGASAAATAAAGTAWVIFGSAAFLLGSLAVWAAGL